MGIYVFRQNDKIECYYKTSQGKLRNKFAVGKCEMFHHCLPSDTKDRHLCKSLFSKNIVHDYKKETKFFILSFCVSLLRIFFQIALYNGDRKVDVFDINLPDESAKIGRLITFILSVFLLSNLFMNCSCY